MPSGARYVCDIVIHDVTEGGWAQAKYLVHGYDDVLWTDDFTAAIQFLTHSIACAEGERLPEGFCAVCRKHCDCC